MGIGALSSALSRTGQARDCDLVPVIRAPTDSWLLHSP